MFGTRVRDKFYVTNSVSEARHDRKGSTVIRYIDWKLLEDFFFLFGLEEVLGAIWIQVSPHLVQVGYHNARHYEQLDSCLQSRKSARYHSIDLQI